MDSRIVGEVTKKISLARDNVPKCDISSVRGRPINLCTLLRHRHTEKEEDFFDNFFGDEIRKLTLRHEMNVGVVQNTYLLLEFLAGKKNLAVVLPTVPVLSNRSLSPIKLC